LDGQLQRPHRHAARVPPQGRRNWRITYAVFGPCYMNEAQPRWVATGHIMACNETDFDEIETDVRQLCSRFNVVTAGYAPWQYAQMARTQTGGDVAPRRLCLAWPPLHT